MFKQGIHTDFEKVVAYNLPANAKIDNERYTAHPESYQVIYSSDTVRAGVKHLASEILDYIKNNVPPDRNLVICPLLRGGKYFANALIEQLNAAFCYNIKVVDLHVQSYSIKDNAQKNIRILKPLPTDLGDEHVLFVDDICDSATSLTFLTKKLTELNPDITLASAVLVDRQRVDRIYTPNFSVFKHHGEEWLVGCGMDDKGDVQTRILPDLTMKVSNDPLEQPLFTGGKLFNWQATYNAQNFQELSDIDLAEQKVHFMLRDQLESFLGSKHLRTGLKALEGCETMSEELRELYYKGYSLVASRAPRSEIRERISFFMDFGKQIFEKLTHRLNDGSVIDPLMVAFYGGFMRGKLNTGDLDGLVICKAKELDAQQSSAALTHLDNSLKQIFEDAKSNHQRVFDLQDTRLTPLGKKFTFNLNVGIDPYRRDAKFPTTLDEISGLFFFKSKNGIVMTFLPDSGYELMYDYQNKRGF